MIRCGIIGAMVLVSLAFGEAARAQHWTQVRISNYHISSMSPYFINSNFGFVFDPYFPGDFYRTLDGGATWTSVWGWNAPPPLVIRELCFTSASTGFGIFDTAVSGSFYGKGCYRGAIYETRDSGSSWKSISPPTLNIRSVYAMGSRIFATVSELPCTNDDPDFRSVPGTFPYPDTLGALYTSSDSGSTWDSIGGVLGLPSGPLAFAEVAGNRDSLVLSLCSDTLTNTYIVYSTDLGSSWEAKQLEQVTSQPHSRLFEMEAFAIPFSCKVIRLFDGDWENKKDIFSFFESSPDFSNSSTILQYETGGWLTGNACALYVSDARDFGAGLMRSTDGGVNWGLVGGPDLGEIDDGDFRNISVVGHGAVVYVTTRNEQLWKTSDGGDGLLNAETLAPKIIFSDTSSLSISDTLYVCDSTSLIVTSNSCDRVKLNAVNIAGLDSSAFTVTRISHSLCSTLPDSDIITIHPSDSEIYQISIKARLLDDEFNKIDSSKIVTLIFNALEKPIIFSLKIKPSTIAAQPGDTIDIPVYLSGTATLGAVSITLPFGLDTNVLRPIGFYLALAGITASVLSYSNGTENVPLRSPGLTLNGETLIGTLRCVVYLGDTLATSVSLANASLSATNIPCVALSLTTDSVNILINGCGDQTLLQFMNTGKITFGIESITPNPASGVAQITFINPTGAPISYSVLDVLGQTCEHGAVFGNALSLDVSRLVPGVYFIRATGEGGISVSRQFIILR